METKLIQLTAGRGPAECAWVVAKLVKVFLSNLALHGIQYCVIQREKGIENGTLQSICFQLSGENLTPFLTDWLGTLQWIGKSPYRKFHKRKNWFVGCFELKLDENLEMNTKDIAFKAVRSSGPGGQHVNKTSTAVQATHAKTGLQVFASTRRSQVQNKKMAIQRLHQKIKQYNLSQLQTQLDSRWKNHLNLERGNPTAVFVGADFKRKIKWKQ